eukprot:1825155-Rhodomonas_salina.2
MSRFVEHFRAIVGHTSEKKLQEAAAKKKEEKSKAAKIMANKKGHSTTLPHIQRSEFQVWKSFLGMRIQLLESDVMH